jgi:cytochrome c oxidase subunit IV
VTVGVTERSRRLSAASNFALLSALTAMEVVVATWTGADRLRTTALAGLLIAKAGVLLAVSLRATWRRPAPRLALLALPLAVGFTVVLMLEAAYQAGGR